VRQENAATLWIECPMIEQGACRIGNLDYAYGL